MKTVIGNPERESVIKAFVYYLLCVLFAVLTAIGYQSFLVFVMGTQDPKFGAMGTVIFSGYIAGICAAVCFTASALWFSWMSKQRGVNPTVKEILAQSLMNGVVLGLIYMPFIHNLPIINGISDWPQYIAGFLVLGFVLSMSSSLMFHQLMRPRKSS